MATGNVLSRGVFVVAAKRTPFGTFGGSLKGHSPVDLQVLASNAAMQSIGLKPENINSVCIGNVLNASSPDAPYLARHVALRCGLPVPTPAYIGRGTKLLLRINITFVIIISEQTLWIWIPVHC